MKLKRKLLLFILLPVILLTSLSSYYAFFTAKDLLQKQLYRTDQFKSADYANQINERLLKYDMTVRNLAAIVARPDVRQSDLLALVKSTAKADAEFFNVMLIFADGRFFNSDNAQLPAGFDARTVDWYKKSMSTDGSKAVYSTPYSDVATKQTVITISVPIIENSQAIGVAAMDIHVETLLSIVAEMKTGQTGYVFVIDEKGNFLAHPEFKSTEQLQAIRGGQMANFYNQLTKGEFFSSKITVDNVECLYSARQIGNTGWRLCTSMATDELFAQVNSMAMMLGIVCLVTILLLGGMILFVIRDITGILGLMKNFALSLAGGDFRNNPRKMLRKDEFGEVSDALVEMRTKIRQLLERISGAAEQLSSASQQLTTGADQSAQAAAQVASSIATVASGANQQLSAAERVDENVHSMATLVEHVAQDIGEVAGNANLTAVKASSGNESVEHAIGQMRSIQQTVGTSAEVVQELGRRSAEIGQIVDTISGIAGQTNLLALNAAIEAARAGEQGKGFAVVAEEVRKLAEQSQEASGHIADLIQQIQTKTDEAVESMNNGTKEVAIGNEVVAGMGLIFKEIGEMITQANQRINEIKDQTLSVRASNEEVVSVTRDIHSLSKNAAEEAQNVSSATEEQAAAMEEMSSSSQSLATLAQDLQAQVNKFQIR